MYVGAWQEFKLAKVIQIKNEIANNVKNKKINSNNSSLINLTNDSNSILSTN